MGQVFAKWSGLDSLIESVEYSSALGTSPGTVTISLVTGTESFEPEDISDVILSDGQNQIQIKNCRIIDIREQKSLSGFKKIVTLQDGRWKWRFGFIDGKYNQFLADGKVDKDTEKTVSQLVRLLLDEMGEEKSKIQGLDKIEPKARPTVEWDHVKPADELESLLQKFGRAIAYAQDGSMSIVEIGKQTSSPPVNGAQELPENKNIVLKPTWLTFIGGYYLNQGNFELEAVALDSDGVEKPIADLSYAPAGGFSNDIDYLYELDPTVREFARKSLFRYYRIKEDLSWDKSVSTRHPLGAVPSYLKKQGITSWALSRLLPLPGKMVDYGSEDNKTKDRDSLVLGEYYDLENNLTTEKDSDGNWPVLPFSWDLDLEKGLIKFDRPIYKVDSGNLVAAKLYCRTAIQSVRLRLSVNIGGPGNTTEVIFDDSLFYTLKDGLLTPESVLEVAPVVSELFKAKQRNYELTQTQGTVKLAGIKPVKLDGVTRQVTYTVSKDSGANTTYSKNTEHEQSFPSLEERQQWAKIRRASSDKNKPRGTG